MSRALHVRRSTPTPGALPPFVPAVEPTAVVLALVRPFALALDRRRAYGGRHPVARAALTGVVEALATALAAHGAIRLHVGREELLLDDTPLPGPVARDLAERLHARRVGALVVRPDVPADAVDALLGWLAREERWHPDAPPPQHPALQVALLRFDHLAIADAPGAAAIAARECWATLARLAGLAAAPGAAAAASPDGEEPDTAPAAREAVVALLRAPGPDVARAHEAAAAIAALADAGAHAAPALREAVGTRVDELLHAAGAPAFVALLRLLDDDVRRRLAVRLADVLPSASLPTWARIVAEACDAPLPPRVDAFATALAARAAGGAPLRALVRALVEARVARASARAGAPHAGAAHPDATRDALGAAIAVAALDAEGSAHDAAREAMRLVRLALACDHHDARIDAAADALVAAGALPALLQRLDAHADGPVATPLRARVVGDDALRTAVVGPPFDAPAAAALLATRGAGDVATLVTLLGDAPDRVARRLVMARLRALGHAVVPALAAAVPGAPWYLARNLLMVLRDGVLADDRARDALLPALPALVPALDDEVAQLRAAAVALLALVPAVRPLALERGLGDADLLVVRTALAAVADLADAMRDADDDPALRPVVTRLLQLVEAPRLDARLRATALLACATARSARVRDRLVAEVVRRTPVLGRLVLAEATPVAVAALHALRRGWRSDPAVAPVLALAQREAHDARWVQLVVDRAPEAWP